MAFLVAVLYESNVLPPSNALIAFPIMWKTISDYLKEKRQKELILFSNKEFEGNGRCTQTN